MAYDIEFRKQIGLKEPATTDEHAVRYLEFMAAITNLSGVWRTGSGAPDNSVGANGDLYLRTSNGDVYKRTAGTYSVIVNLKGADGADGADGAAGAAGSVWRVGSGAPSDGTGVNTDLWLDSDTGDVYQRAAGTYTVVANIKGPAGS